MKATSDPLHEYNAKRDFGRTPEPRGDTSSASADGHSFVIQKHAATALHYDVRLELDGVMLSWAVPKGPSLDPKDKRLALRTENHPISYNSFEGTIPEGHYGAGNVIVWDRGRWAPVGDPHHGLAIGKLEFSIDSEKLAGLWELVRTARPGDKRERWLLFKKQDEHARPREACDVTAARPDSVVTGRPLAPRHQAMPPMRARAARAGKTAASATSANKSAAAPRAALPIHLSPQLATLASTAPAAGHWIYEAKLDGYRVLARVQDGTVRLLTRGGKDWSTRMSPLVQAIHALDLGSSWLDGEVVVLVDGVPNFNRLQNAFDTERPGDVIYFVFDAPFLAGADLRQLPLSARRERLEAALATRQTNCLRLNVALEGEPAALLAQACRVGLEGIMAKRADALYVEGRGTDWLKLKCQRRQEFVVGGYTPRTGGRATAADEVGSLLLGYHDDASRRLRFAGSVGTGWDSKTAQLLKSRLDKLAVSRSPFDATQAGVLRSTAQRHWVRPRMVVEVAFSDWTPDGQLRHPSFQGVRLDKKAADVRREQAVVPPASKSGSRR